MAFARLLKIMLAALVIGLTGGPTVVAQSDALQFILEQARQRRAAEDRARRRAEQRRQRPIAAPTARRTPSTVIVRDTPETPKVDPTTFIVVLGDSFAEQLAGGVDEAFEAQPEVAVIRRTRPESGLARADFYDWPKSVRELLASDQKITFAVIQMGANDRQPIREEPNLVHEPGGERWRELYLQRLDSVIRGFAERQIPVFWVGMPPMQSVRYSAEMMALNELVRAQAPKSGGQFIDIWEPFVDAENKFSAYGPDLSGQNTKLRANDGVHFTRAGARKAAHFIELELRRMMENRSAPTVIAIPAQPSKVESLPLELQPGGVERAIDRMVQGLPEPSAVPNVPVKPAAGPILPLNQPTLSPGGALASARDPRPTGEAQAIIERAYSEGQPADYKPGRIDDFRWTR